MSNGWSLEGAEWESDMMQLLNGELTVGKQCGNGEAGRLLRGLGS